MKTRLRPGFREAGGGGVSAAETGGCRNPCGFVCTGTQQPGVPVLPSDRGNGTEEPKHRNVRKHDRIRRERNVRLNPVFEKEMKRNSRSSRISWIIFVCNLLLAVVAFVCYFGESSQLGYLAPVSYSVPMNCYILMTYLLFILVVLSVPAVAGGSISLEREKKTLDVLLTTNLNPWRIITGKLEASLGVVLILTVSALPVLSLVVVFGGIGLGGLLLMAGGLLLTGIFVGSIGIFCSVVFKRTTLATVLSYVIVVFLVVGICACTGLAYYAGLLQQEMTAAYQQIDVGGVIYLLLFNPFTSFAGIISRQLGNGREMEQLCYLLGNYGQNPLIHYLPEASAVLQLLISAVLLVTAGRKLNPLNK